MEGEKTGGAGQLKEGHGGRRGVAGGQEGRKGGEGEKDEKSRPHGCSKSRRLCVTSQLQLAGWMTFIYCLSSIPYIHC